MKKSEFIEKLNDRVNWLDKTINNESTINESCKIEDAGHGVNLWVGNTIWHFVPNDTIEYRIYFPELKEIAENYFRTLDLHRRIAG